jgi:hypothetical protein
MVDEGGRKRWHSSDSGERRDRGASIAVFAAPSDLGGPDEVLDALLERLEALPSDAVLVAGLGFDPSRLAARLMEGGFDAVTAPGPSGFWSLEVRLAEAPEILDLRDLEAPEPLERILEAAAGLAPGEALFARVPRFPRMLLPHLDRRGLAWEVYEEVDGTALVCVRRPR